MSYYSTITGCIQVKSLSGMAVLHRCFDEWTDPQAEGQVELGDFWIDFSGYYRNIGRRIEPCLQELHQIGELADVNLDEETTDGFEAEFHFELQEGIPFVTVTKPSGETTIACVLDARHPGRHET
jgi:hypothetical protein